MFLFEAESLEAEDTGAYLFNQTFFFVCGKQLVCEHFFSVFFIEENSGNLEMFLRDAMSLKLEDAGAYLRW